MSNIRAFTMPKWGIEMEEGVIREWHAEVGQHIKEGDLFVVIETDKIANDVELEFSGMLRALPAEEGETYKVGALIAVFADEDVPQSEVDAFVADFKPVNAGFGLDGDEDDAPAAEDELPAAAPEPAIDITIPEDLDISPKAAELAISVGLDVSSLTGSIRRGRITLQDVEQAAKAQGLMSSAPAPGLVLGGESNSHVVVKLSAMRKAIATRLAQANNEVPHFYLRTDIEMDRLIALREDFKAATGSAPSINDFIIKASAIALHKTPDVNVHFVNDTIHRFKNADIAVAVSVPGGLVTPVVRNAGSKTVQQISQIMRDLAERARAEKLEQAEYQGGTFSISNLGMYGVTGFDAFINPPMGAILAIGATTRQPSEAGGFKSVMQVTLSCDHRAIDGALGGEFLQAFKAAMEAPGAL
ncbi:MAG: dihydrolipoamide acetyltransferase family protein [Pseudomonadota bacterium]